MFIFTIYLFLDGDIDPSLLSLLYRRFDELPTHWWSKGDLRPGVLGGESDETLSDDWNLPMGHFNNKITIVFETNLIGDLENVRWSTFPVDRVAWFMALSLKKPCTEIRPFYLWFNGKGYHFNICMIIEFDADFFQGSIHSFWKENFKKDFIGLLS